MYVFMFIFCLFLDLSVVITEPSRCRVEDFDKSLSFLIPDLFLLDELPQINRFRRKVQHHEKYTYYLSFPPRVRVKYRAG